MTTTSRTRPAAAPAYYLGRPARMWRVALRHRAHGSRRPDITPAFTRDRDHMVARYSGVNR